MESPRKDNESVCACCLTTDSVPQSDRRRKRVVLVTDSCENYPLLKKPLVLKITDLTLVTQSWRA